MPVRQQYFIASAIIGLIGVMVVFAMFDYFSDRSRFAERKAGRAQGAVALAGAPYPASLNPVALGSSLCPLCNRIGAGPENARCPNCRAFLRNPSAGVAPVSVQNAAFTWFQPQPTKSAWSRGGLSCPSCNFVMSSKHNATPNSIRCPRCPAYLVTSAPAAGSPPGGM